MRRIVFCLLPLLLLAQSVWAGPTVRMTTSLGVITLELDQTRAPRSVANFLRYVDAGFYPGTLFHRVIPGFMIQGGGYDVELHPRTTGGPIPNEAANGLQNRRGTIAMARTAKADSATSQFFINLKDNPFLDHRGADPRGFGYAVFGRVVAGMEVVDRIARTPTRRASPRFQDLPQTPVLIESISRGSD